MHTRLITLILCLLGNIVYGQQSMTITLSFTGGYCEVCSSTYACSNNHGEWNDGVKEFMDPLPVGANVTNVKIKVFYASEGGTYTVKLNDRLMAETESITNPYCGTCNSGEVQSSDIIYNLRAMNKIQIQKPSSGYICVNRLEVTFYYYCNLSTSITSSNMQSVCAGCNLSLTSNSTGANAPSYSWSSTPSGFSSTQQNPNFTTPCVESDTYYKITLTTTDGACSATATVGLTVTVPKIQSVASFPVCPNNGNQLVVSPSISVVYKSSCRDAVCANQASLMLSVHTPPIIISSINTNIKPICPNTPITLTANCMNNSAVWYNGTTNNVLNISPSETTNYIASCTENVCSFANPSILINVVSENLLLSGISIGNVLKQALNTISSTEKLNNSSNIIYRSGNSILLNSGFQTSTGTVFKSEIGPCIN
jgi:hypothetical protein